MRRTGYFCLPRPVHPFEDAMANNTNRSPVVSFDDPRSRTIQEFADIENFSLSFYYAMRRHRKGPKESRPDGKVIRITREAHVEWREQTQAQAESEEAVLQMERRREQTAAAGRRAAQVRRHG